MVWFKGTLSGGPATQGRQASSSGPLGLTTRRESKPTHRCRDALGSAADVRRTSRVRRVFRTAPLRPRRSAAGSVGDPKDVIRAFWTQLWASPLSVATTPAVPPGTNAQRGDDNASVASSNGLPSGFAERGYLALSPKMCGLLSRRRCRMFGTGVEAGHIVSVTPWFIRRPGIDMGLSKQAVAGGSRGVPTGVSAVSCARLAVEDPASRSNHLSVELLDGFRLFHGGQAVAMSRGSEQLLAFVALRRQSVGRILVAGTLWPNVDERRAYAALRSALARLDVVSRAALEISPLSLSLAGGVAVDFRDAQALAHRLVDPATPSAECDLSATAIATLSVDLLPSWYDDWALREAEDWRQLRLHALEVIAVDLTTAGHFGDAAAAGAAAVRADPLRESAHTVLIRVHLAEGNRSEALREFDRLGHLLKAELDLEPSTRLRALIATL